MEKIVEVFTDGACSGNPGPGGWAALLRYNHHTKILTGAEPFTTNNRMEMLAAIEALESLKRPCKVIITTDSQYLMKGVTEWMSNWKKRAWKTSQKSPVKNQDLWQRLDAVLSKHHVEWKWVRGHSDHEENILMDKLAREAIRKSID
jgi:ribonuclease HI